MVSLCVMGWGLVLLENSSVAVAAAVTQGGPPPGTVHLQSLCCLVVRCVCPPDVIRHTFAETKRTMHTHSRMSVEVLIEIIIEGFLVLYE